MEPRPYNNLTSRSTGPAESGLRYDYFFQPISLFRSPPLGRPVSSALGLTMPRQMSPEKEREYAELHAYLDFYATQVSGINPSDPVHPTNVGRQIVESFGRSKAFDGLKQAVNDTVEELSQKPIEYIQRLDAALQQNGIITFSEVRRRYASSYKRILERRRIETETEYYLVAGVLADTSSSATAEERALLEQMVSGFENAA